MPRTLNPETENPKPYNPPSHNTKAPRPEGGPPARGALKSARVPNTSRLDLLTACPNIALPVLSPETPCEVSSEP